VILLDASMARILGSEFDADLARGMTDDDGIALVATSTEILTEACRMAARHGLRTLDAIHLGTLIAVHERIAPARGFACFDHRLRAATEGLSVFPDTLPSL
jgi:hypothetical protein